MASLSVDPPGHVLRVQSGRLEIRGRVDLNHTYCGTRLGPESRPESWSKFGEKGSFRDTSAVRLASLQLMIAIRALAQNDD